MSKAAFQRCQWLDNIRFRSTKPVIDVEEQDHHTRIMNDSISTGPNQSVHNDLIV